MPVKVPVLPLGAHALLEQILFFAGERPEGELADLRARLERLLSLHGEAAVQELVTRIRTTGAEFTYYPPDPLAREINHAVGDLVVPSSSALLGIEHLAAVQGRPAVFLSNHLSYSDANLFEVLLCRAGFGDVARRLTVIAGPKVYSDPMRRFSSLCFGTIKTPQSSTRSSEEAVMSTRQVARLARETLTTASERRRQGDALVVFVEGTRSRSGAMQRALPAVTRYLEDPEVLLVPMAITGSEQFVPVDDERIHSTRVVIQIGLPAESGALGQACHGNRRLTMDAVGVAIARLLPEPYRGAYAGSDADLEEPRRIADAIFAHT
jgi:1-acyl-sn-glycerol-3-phosphate acyltransferase